jgi:segregation and condensation protein B
MDYFGINNAEDLPKISEVLAEQMIEPTLVNAEHFDVEGAEVKEENIVLDEQTIGDEEQQIDLPAVDEIIDPIDGEQLENSDEETPNP